MSRKRVQMWVDPEFRQACRIKKAREFPEETIERVTKRIAEDITLKGKKKNGSFWGKI